MSTDIHLHDERPTLDLGNLTLKMGPHDDPSCGMCVMEARTVWHGWDWSDGPEQDSPVIAAFLRSWNDALPSDEDRSRLLARFVDVPATASSPEVEDARSWMAMDWLVREYAPVWLRLAGLGEQADRLAGLAEFRAGMDLAAVQPVIDATRSDANATRAAAGDAARDAAWDAAGDAAGEAAREAAADAAWAAGDAAQVAAWDAARAAAGDAAGDAGDAARAAAWVATRAAWAAARVAAGVAAGGALQPAVVECQESAGRLLDRMIAAGATS